ncbi:acetyltransferase, partial [Vibrio parahaemolyticus]
AASVLRCSHLNRALCKLINIEESSSKCLNLVVK